MSKILITGGGGYVGSMLCTTLVNLGHEVTVVDLMKYDRGSLNHLYYHKNFKLIKKDVRDVKLLKKVIRKNEYIIPLAALVGAPLCDKNKKDAVSVNYKSIKDLVSLCSKKNKIIFLTTNSGYGVGEKNKFCDENSPLRPISLYGKTKCDAENEVIKSRNFICFRLATVFGPSPRMRLDLLVNDFTFRAFKDEFIVLYESNFKRNYIHVNDIANVFLFCIENKKTNNEIFNVGLSDTNISKLELCETIKKFVPTLNIIESQYKKDPDQRNYIVSNAKIEKAGFKTMYSLEDGITSLLKTFKIIGKNIHSNI